VTLIRKGKTEKYNASKYLTNLQGNKQNWNYSVWLYISQNHLNVGWS